jgi:DNA-binding SARP family transcriptional activator/class 3 adenylate cyclase
MIEIRLLGPVAVDTEHGSVRLSATLERALLARLALEPGRTIGRTHLIGDLWGETPPRSGAASLQSLVYRLRTSLGEAGHMVLLRASGYSVDIPPAQVDACRFEDLVRTARSLREAGESKAAGERLRTALGLWRGPSFAGLEDVPFVVAQATRLEEGRLAALEDRIDVDLSLGRHAEVVPELEALVQEHPLRERIWCQLMVALYRAGSQAGALRAYGRLRSILGDELGIDPAPATRALEASILQQDPLLDLENYGGDLRAAPPSGEAAGVSADASSTPSDPEQQDRVTVALLLTDIEASSDLWERHEEDMSVALARHDELIASVVTSAGGTVVKQQGEGDAAFVVFRRPLEAITAAARLRKAFAREPWPETTPIRVRIAVAAGEARTREGDYFGPTVNRAARLRSLARGGQVLVGATAALLAIDELPPELQLVDLGLHKLRGHHRPERVFELAGDGDIRAEPLAPPDLSNLAWALASPDDRFVGRHDELQRVQAELALAASGVRRFVAIGGEPGIGKTWLAGETARRLHAEGALVLYGHCDADAIVPYQPFVEALTFYAHSCPPSSLRSDLESWGPALAPLFPDVVAAVGGVPLPSGSAETERFRMFEAVDRWIVAMATRSPVAFVIDDLHWADQSSLLLLRHLVQSPLPASLLVVATHRDTSGGMSPAFGSLLSDLRRRTDVTRIDLSGLTADEMRTYLERRAGHELGPDADELVAALWHETAGHPLFLAELVGNLVETGAVRLDRGKWRAAGGASALPESIRDVVSQRLLRLSERCRQALVVAAAVGLEFDGEVVSRVTGVEREECFEALEECVAARLLEEALAEDRYVFRHHIVRQALYEGLSRYQRRRLHRRIALALETLPGDDSDRSLDELAWHWCAGASTAEDVENAAGLARNAGARAAAQLAFEAAAEHYRRGLEVIKRRTGTSAEMTVGLLLELGDVLNKSGNPAEGQAVFVEAAERARAANRPDLFAEAALGYGGVLPAAADNMDDTGEGLLSEALAQPSTVEDETVRACVLARLAHWTYWSRARRDRENDCRTAVELARASGSRETLAAVLNSCYWALDGPDDLDAQLARGEEITRLGEELSDREVTLHGLKCRLHALLTKGDLSEADEVARRLEQLAEEIRQPEYLRLGTMYRALMAGAKGDWTVADSLAARNFSMMQDARHPHSGIVYVAQLLPCRWLQGRAGELADVIDSSLLFNPRRVLLACVTAWSCCDDDKERARTLLDRIDLRWFSERERDFDWLAICATTAMAIESLGDVAWAEQLYPLLLPYADRNCMAGQSAFLGTMEHHLGSLGVVAGRWDEAVSHLDRALDRHARMQASPFLAFTQVARARALLGRSAAGDAAEAQRMMAEAEATARRLNLGAVTTRLNRLKDADRGDRR